MDCSLSNEDRRIGKRCRGFDCRPCASYDPKNHKDDAREVCGKKFILCNDPVCEGDKIADELEVYIDKYQKISAQGNKSSNMTFGEALEHIKQGPSYSVTRKTWYGSEPKPRVYLQRPDEDSKMTLPYLYMAKYVSGEGVAVFPLDLSCESILAEDWEMVI